MATATVHTPRLKALYETQLRTQLKDSLELGNIMQVPKIEKIVIAMGVGAAVQQPSLLDNAIRDLTTIAGQKPVVTRAKKSIAGFKLREGMSIGCRVTLRGERMYEMIDRLVSIALPRIRDFRGIDPGQFDGRGNFAMGVREQTIFPEIDYDSVETFRGLNIVITTTAKTDEEGRALLAKLGMPFRAN